MEYSRYLDCLADDFARLRALVPTNPTAPVPTCPGWSVTDLTRHVGEVYLHKTLAIRDGVEAEPWPPAELASEAPLALLDRAYAELLSEFATHDPEDPAGSWYAPGRSVGFWIRRMAQETVIHRIDAELGVGAPVAPVPDDLAVDGVDELLRVFVEYSVAEWADAFHETLAGSPGWTFTGRADDTAWTVRTEPAVFRVTDGVADAADVTVTGPPAAMLRWAWGRELAGEPSGVRVDGPAEAVAELRRCIVIATQ